MVPAVPFAGPPRSGKGFTVRVRARLPVEWLLPAPLPSLVIVGAMKAGTTSLFEYLCGHPQLVPSRHKEVHFFDRGYHRGAGWYRRQFRAASWRRAGPGVTFESSPYYMYEPRVPARMRATLPEAKLVFLLRDPVDRAFSHYHNNRRLGREPLGFEEAIDAEEARLAGEEQRLLADPRSTSRRHQRCSYLARGRYAEQLVRWREHFPAGQMMVVDAGRLFDDPRRVVAEVVAFLGLDRWEPGHLRAHNEGRYGVSMRPATRRRLEEYFAPHERALCDLVGWCPSHRPDPRAAEPGRVRTAAG